jgi:hypothetical protein
VKCDIAFLSVVRRDPLDAAPGERLDLLTRIEEADSGEITLHEKAARE